MKRKVIVIGRAKNITGGYKIKIMAATMSGFSHMLPEAKC